MAVRQTVSMIDRGERSEGSDNYDTEHECILHGRRFTLSKCVSTSPINNFNRGACNGNFVTSYSKR